MKIFTISGLGADERVFKNLTLESQMIHIPWLPFEKKDTMRKYALRLVEQFNITKQDVLVGVSFGGMLAIEIAEATKLKKVILISSAENSSELPYFLRIPWPIKLVPNFIIQIFKPFSALLFGTKDKILIRSILKETKPCFIKNAVYLILHWKRNKSASFFCIHGDNDFLIPHANKPNQHLLQGGHLMIVDQGKEVSRLINEYIKKEQSSIH